MNNTPQQCKEILEEYYGTQCRGIILYGSHARQDSTPTSDIDLLVLLSQPFDYFQELRRIVDLLYPLQLESDQHISAKPAPEHEFQNGEIQLYRNVLREGVRL